MSSFLWTTCILNTFESRYLHFYFKYFKKIFHPTLVVYGMFYVQKPLNHNCSASIVRFTSCADINVPILGIGLLGII